MNATTHQSTTSTLGFTTRSLGQLAKLLSDGKNERVTLVTYDSLTGCQSLTTYCVRERSLSLDGEVLLTLDVVHTAFNGIAYTSRLIAGLVTRVLRRALRTVTHGTSRALTSAPRPVIARSTHARTSAVVDAEHARLVATAV